MNPRRIDAPSVADEDRHVLHAIDGIGNRRCVNTETGIEAPQMLTARGVISVEIAATGALKHEIADCGECPAIPEAVAEWHFPALALSHRVPRQQSCGAVADLLGTDI